MSSVTYPEFIDEIGYATDPPWPAPQTPASGYHLTEDQVRFYDTQGYLILRGWVRGEMLASLREAGDRWIRQMEDIDAGKGAPEGVAISDYSWATRSNGQRVPYRVDYLYNKKASAALEFLGSPEVLGIAESLAGKNFVPTYESMVFKMAGDGEAINWHQDACFPRRFRVFNIDLYLDRSETDGGALRVLPGTQIRKQDICRLVGEIGFNQPNQVVVEMEPGDILIHDTMVVHGSPRVSGNALRRTLYYEFRPAEQIEQEGLWDANWIERRMKLLQLGLRSYAARYPAAPKFNLRSDARHRPEITADGALELKIAHIDHTPGTYCSANSR